MKAERGMTNGNCSHLLTDGFMDGFVSRSSSDSFATIRTSSSSVIRSSSTSPPPSSCGLNYIEHRVSKMDTLAGVAIKYGVEVADIRRLNGLVTDLQMFAHKSLQIPLPGRHPPSPIMSNGSASNREHTPPHRPVDDVLDSLQSLRLKPPRRVSPAMSSLQGYYGLTPPKRGPVVEGTEMAVYKTGRALHLEDGSLRKESPVSGLSLSHHRKSRSLVSLENADINGEDIAVADAGESSEAERSIRRRQKVDTDQSSKSPGILMKEENGGGFSMRTGKGLALRPKVGGRADMDSSWQNFISQGDSFMSDVLVAVRKSSSTSNLQESESTSSSLWPTSKWPLKQDAFARPIFDGLPKPITARRNKAALD